MKTITYKREVKPAAGFTLIEVMMVVAIIGILAAISIPHYLNFVGLAKIKTCASNFAIASAFVSNELTKEPSKRSPDVVAYLNQGNKKDPFDRSQPAFVNGTATISNGKCQVGIANSGGGGADLRTVTVNDTVTINGVNGGNALSATEVIYVVRAK